MYLLESPRRGDSNKYPKRMFSQRITWGCQRKNTRTADFCSDRIDIITKFAVIADAVIILQVREMPVVSVQPKGNNSIKGSDWTVVYDKYVSCIHYGNIATLGKRVQQRK